jgi:putative membrane protein
MMGWYGDVGWSPAAMVVMGVLMLVFWGLVAWGVVALVRGLGDDRRSGPSDPGRVLDERFARGELTEDEYLSARSLLAAQQS